MMDNGNKRQHETLDRLVRNIQQFKGVVDDKMAVRLQLDLIERMARRLDAFDCADCRAMLDELDQQVVELIVKKGALDKAEQKAHGKLVGCVQTHLVNTHQLVTEGYYTGICMSLGISFGLVFGLTLFDNLAMGMPLGIAFGLAIGAGLDADARKKGKVI